MQETQLTSEQAERVVEQVGRALDAVLAVDPDELLAIVQAAHESKWHDMHEPPPRFAVSNRDLRMFWRFRTHLEPARVTEDPD